MHDFFLSLNSLQIFCFTRYGKKLLTYCNLYYWVDFYQFSLRYVEKQSQDMLEFRKRGAAKWPSLGPQVFPHYFCLKLGIEISSIVFKSLDYRQKLVLLFQKCQTSFYGSKVRCLLSDYLWVTLQCTIRSQNISKKRSHQHKF